MKQLSSLLDIDFSLPLARNEYEKKTKKSNIILKILFTVDSNLIILRL